MLVTWCDSCEKTPGELRDYQSSFVPPVAPESKRREPKNMGARRSQLSWSRPLATRDWLQCEAEFKVNARVHRIAQVIHAVNLDHINVLGVEPIAGPHANESERITTVLEAVIAVLGLADTKRVLLSEIGLVPVCGNAVAVTSGVLPRCALLGRLGVLLLLRCRFFWLRSFLVLGRFSFLFVLLVILCEHRNCDSERQRQNCCTENSYQFHRGC